MPAARPHVISAWSAVSPYGTGRVAFGAGFGDPAVRPAHTVAGFDPVGVLGPKGTRSLDRMTALAISAVGGLLAEPDRSDAAEDTAVVLGTTTGSVQSTMDFARDSLTGAKPFHVDPGRFPNTTMNCPASRSAIWHQLKGPNATVAGGVLAGQFALRYARRLLDAGRAASVIFGGTEECSPARSRLAARAGEDGTDPDLGEGCAVFRLRPGPAADPVAEVLAVRLFAFGEDKPAEVLADCVRAALADAGAAAAEVRTVATSGTGTEDGTLPDVLRGADPRQLAVRPRLGDTGAATAGFQLAATLSAAGPGLALVTGVDRDCGAGCVVLRIP